MNGTQLVCIIKKDIFWDHATRQAGLLELGADYAHQITTWPLPRIFQTFPWPFQVTQKWHQKSIFLPNFVNHQICWSALPLIFMVIIFFDQKCNSGFLGKFFNSAFYLRRICSNHKKVPENLIGFPLTYISSGPCFWISYFLPSME